jgi:peptidylprolyl isomerase
VESEANDVEASDDPELGRPPMEPAEDGAGEDSPRAEKDNHDADEPWSDEDLLLQIARNTATTKTLTAAVLVVMLVGLLGLGFLVVNRTSTTSSVAASPSTSGASSDAQAAPSVAGEPCVATSDPLPAGAPPVDVEVGPPPTQLVVKDLKEGTGATVASTDTVTVNYIVQACSTGKILDSSYDSGSPATISLGQVIPGVAAGVTGMKVGGQRLIGIPSDQAYGPTGNPPTIAPDESIWFVVEVTAITPA